VVRVIRCDQQSSLLDTWAIFDTSSFTGRSLISRTDLTSLLSAICSSVLRRSLPPSTRASPQPLNSYIRARVTHLRPSSVSRGTLCLHSRSHPCPSLSTNRAPGHRHHDARPHGLNEGDGAVDCLGPAVKMSATPRMTIGGRLTQRHSSFPHVFLFSPPSPETARDGGPHSMRQFARTLRA